MSRIAVALSGGVDSSVALSLLKDEGHDLVGVTMRHLTEECFDLWEGSCCSRAAIMSAKRLCDGFGIEHHVIDYSGEFESDVLAPSAREYASGRTPNPCCMCNERLKFGRLFEKATALGAELIATGHYARTIGGALFTAVDEKRDQSYFLYRLSLDVLKRTLFPLGGLTKDEVREIARARGLESRDKKDSMEICFAPEGDFTRVFERFAPEAARPGELIDGNGEVVGAHPGIGFVTIGQRRGLGLKDRQGLYAVRIDAERNAVHLGPRPTAENARVGDLVMRIDKREFRTKAKIRSQHAGVMASVKIEGDYAEVAFDAPVENLTPGQACVFYLESEVLGGGVIEC